MPLQYEQFGGQPKPETIPGAVQARSPAPTRTPYETQVYQSYLARKLEVSASRTTEMFKWLDQGAIKQVPFTLAHTTTASQDEGLTYAVNDAVTWMSTVYGNDALGALALSNLITDPVSRARTQAVLFDISNTTVVAPTSITRGGAGATLDQAESALHDVLASPDPAQALLALTPALGASVQTLAKQFQDSLSSAAAGGNSVADQFGRVIAVAQNGYSIALNPQDQAILGSLVKSARTGIGGTTQGNLGTEAASLGITQFRRLGQGEIVLDKEWAKAHPDEALAEKLFLEAQYPGSSIVLGKQGIIGSVLDKFGMAIDYTTAFGGAALHQITEELNRFGSGDRQANLNAIADAVRITSSGGPPPDWVASIMKTYGQDPNDPQQVALFLQHQQDQNTVDVGIGAFWQDLKDNTRPQMLGFGLADNVMKSADILPGDANYNTAHTAVGIISQFAFDPAMWGPAVVGGLRDAGVFSRLIGDVAGVPKFIDAASGTETVLQVSNSAIHQYVYTKFARTAEETVQTKSFINAATSLYEVRKAAGSEAAFATMLNDVAGVDLVEARRMASMVTSPEGGGIALLDDALGTGRTDTLDRIYGIQAKLDDVNAKLAREAAVTSAGSLTSAEVADFERHGPQLLDMLGADVRQARLGGTNLVGQAYDSRELGNDVVRMVFPGDPSTTWFFKMRDNKAVGYLSVEPGNVVGTFVTPELRRQGIATELARAAADQGDISRDPTVLAAQTTSQSGEALGQSLAQESRNMDLLAEKNVYESVLQGHDSIRDAQSGFMGGKQIRRLRAAADLKTSVFDAAIDAVGHSIAEFPANIFVRDSDALMRVREANPGAEPAIQVMFGKLGHLWRKPGFGTKFVFEDTTEFSRVAGVEAARTAVARAEAAGNAERLATARSQLDSALTELVNTPNASLQNLHSIATELGVSDSRYRQLIEPYVSGQIKGDRAAQFDWFKTTYSSLIDESTVLDGLAKKGLHDLYSTWYEDRNAARLTTSGYHGSVTTEPVLVREIPGGKPYGIPSIDADLVRSIDLPSLQQFRSYATMTGRTMKTWEQAGVVRRAISLSHGALARGWRTYTSIWRSSVLFQKLIFALPARIIGEQQLRMAAFDYSSMMWHPSEWLASTNWGERFFKDDALMWDAAGSPIHALGTMVDDMRGRVPIVNKAVATIDGGIAGEQDAFFRSYSQMLTKYSASPSVTRWRMADGEIRSPEDVLQAMQAETAAPLRTTWLNQFSLTRQIGDTRPEAEIIKEALGRWDQEMRQLVGYDPENIVKNAITDRKVVIDGETYQIGTSQFAKKLQELRAEDRWQPGMHQLPTKLGEYLPGDKVSHMKGLTDKLFKMFYSAPDLATSRVPLYRQIFKRQYQNLIKLGYQDERAVEVAHSIAAESTADMLFQLGAHTNGEYLLREIMPFFPAYRELATTWIGRIPARIGQLEESHAAAVGWVIGASALAERANLVLKDAVSMGLVSKDPNGDYFINAPMFGNILAWQTFGDVKFHAHVPLSSLAGLLPFPNLGVTDDQGRPLPLAERLRQMLPSLGGPAVDVLALLKSKFPTFFGPVEDWTTMFGSDTSLGIPLIDQIWEGVTHSPSPFALGRAETLHNAQIQFALIDGMRLAIHETPMPMWPGPNLTNAQSAAYEKKWLAWRAGILKAGSDYQQHLYLLKAAIGALLPFSVQFSDQYKTEVASMWQMLNHIPGGSTGAVGKAEMQFFLGRNPGLEPFLVGKTLDTRLYDHPSESLQDFFKAIADGKVIVRNSNDWVTYAVATNSFSEHMANVSRIRAGAGQTWQEVLLNFDAKQQLSQESDRWQAFLDWNHNHMASLGIPDVRSMLDAVQQYKAIRTGTTPNITLDQQRLISFDQTMRHYAKYFDYNPASAGAYSKLRGQAYDALFKSIGAPSDISKGISQWFKHTADPYYSKLDKLYTKLDTAKPSETETIYTQIRKLSDAYDAGRIKSTEQPLFSAEGPKFYDKAYAHNKDFAVTGPYQTKLSPTEETAFRQWVASNGVPFDPKAKVTDYDMRGFWKSTGGAGWNQGDHFPDTYKTPYDTTFSQESIYATPDNPFTWQGDRLVDTRTGKLVFGAPLVTTTRLGAGDPTPEEYVFAKKTPQEQQQAVAKWAALPGVYLTAFQRRQVGYQGDDKSLTKYANYSSWLNTQMRKYATSAGITVNTLAWDALTKRRDEFLARKADVLKVTDSVKEYNAPTYVRVGKALNLNGTSGWDKVTTLVHQADVWLGSVRGGTGVSPAGSTVEAQKTRTQFGKLVEEYRQNDPSLDKALNEIGTALGKTNHYDLYDYLFFDKLF